MDTNDDNFADDVEWYNRFQAGVTAADGPLQPDEVRYMIYLVAYDITEPKRLRRVAKTCEDYGARVEKSVFECDLPYEEFQRLWLELMGIIDESEDKLISYRICGSCLKEVESMGSVPRPEKPVCYIL